MEKKMENSMQATILYPGIYWVLVEGGGLRVSGLRGLGVKGFRV